MWEIQFFKSSNYLYVIRLKLYPTLNALFEECGLVLVNSERLSWIHVRPLKENVTQSDKKMPDFFGCQPAFYKSENAYNASSETLKEGRSRE